MDLRAQTVTIWLRKWWVAGGAVVVGLLVLLLSSLAPPVYAAGLTARVVQTGGGDSAPLTETTSLFAQTVAGLAVTVATLDDIVARSGLPLTRDEAAEQISVAATSTPGFVTITGRAGDPDSAARLADATAAALVSRVSRDNAVARANSSAPLRAQLAALNAQLVTLPPTAPDRTLVQEQSSGLIDAITRLETGQSPQLLLGAPASVPPIPESPTPRRDAVLGLLVALVALAEGVVLVRAVRGRIAERAPAAEVEQLTGRPAIELRTRDTANAMLTPLVAEHLGDVGLVTVVQLGGPKDFDIGRELRTAAALVSADPTTTRFRVQTVRGARVDQRVLESVRGQGGVVVLAFDTARMGRRELEVGLAALVAVGVEVRGAVVWRGRLPRERSSPGGAVSSSLVTGVAPWSAADGSGRGSQPTDRAPLHREGQPAGTGGNGARSYPSGEGGSAF